MALHIGLDCRGNIQQPMPFFCVPDSFEEALSRYINEILRLRRDGPAGECRRTVPMESVNVRSHIDADDVAFLQNPFAGNAMDDLIVDADAGAGGGICCSEGTTEPHPVCE